MAIYEEYKALYQSKVQDTLVKNELFMRVWIGTMYCNDSNLDPNVDAELDERLKVLAELGEEDLIDCIFDAINAPIYRRQGLIP